MARSSTLFLDVGYHNFTANLRRWDIPTSPTSPGEHAIAHYVATYLLPRRPSAPVSVPRAAHSILLTTLCMGAPKSRHPSRSRVDVQIPSEIIFQTEVLVVAGLSTNHYNHRNVIHSLWAPRDDTMTLAMRQCYCP